MRVRVERQPKLLNIPGRVNTWRGALSLFVSHSRIEPEEPPCKIAVSRWINLAGSINFPSFTLLSISRRLTGGRCDTKSYISKPVEMLYAANEFWSRERHVSPLIRSSQSCIQIKVKDIEHCSCNRQRSNPICLNCVPYSKICQSRREKV